MINEFNELKNFILSFNIFEDNQFLDQYRNLSNAMWGKHFIFLNDGVRNYKWDLSKPIPEHLNKGRIKVKKKD